MFKFVLYSFNQIPAHMDGQGEGLRHSKRSRMPQIPEHIAGRKKGSDPCRGVGRPWIQEHVWKGTSQG